MRERFERCADEALGRRPPGWLNATVFSSAQMPVLAAIGLAGLYAWGWSPLTLFLMLLAGLFAAILVCTLRWLVARPALRLQVERHNDDRLVWAMVGAQRDRRDYVEAGELLRYRAGAGLLVDWLLGLMAAGLLAHALLRLGLGSLAQLAAVPGLQSAVLVAVALPVVQGVLALRSWRNAARSSLDSFGAGIYGVLALAFAATFALGVDSVEGLRKLMIGINLGVIVLGGVGLLGCVTLHRETVWLREQLQGRKRAE